MLFNSYVFIFAFLPVVLSGYYLLARRDNHRLSVGWLVGCSIFFYGWWNPVYVLLLLASILVNYFFGMALSSRAERSAAKRLILFAGVAFNLALLGYFKYAGLIVTSVEELLGAGWHIETIVLPLAISFFTFQQVAYLVDASRGLTREYRFLDYCLFVTFFPQLIAGPIVHHGEMIPQFSSKDRFGRIGDSFSVGVTIFVFGLAKKVLLADNAAVFANDVFDGTLDGSAPTFAEAWIGALAFTFQLYFDFSGYSDMAIGLARMFGIRLPLNFNSPYKARSITEFWHRWHMTLSRFLRDYLYFPLGGNRKGIPRRYVNLMITMLLGGIWHGAGWTFLVWGALHGFYLVINHFFAWICKTVGLGSLSDSRVFVFAGRVLTFLVVLIAWVIFRAETFESARIVLRSLVGTDGFGTDTSFNAPKAIGMVVVLAAIALLAPNTQEIMRLFRPAINVDEDLVLNRPVLPVVGTIRWRPQIRWAVVTAVLAVLSVLSLSRVEEFLYFQF